MRGVFEHAWTTLNKIAFLLSPDIERFLDKECQVFKYLLDCFSSSIYIYAAFHVVNQLVLKTSRLLNFFIAILFTHCR